MRVARPSIFGLSALVSLLTTATIVVAWAVTYLPGGLHVLASEGKLVVLSVEISDPDYAERVADGPGAFLNYLRVVGGPPATFAGAEYKTGDYEYRSGRAYRFALVAVPFAVLVVPAALPACVWFAVRLKSRRCSTAGYCSGCGYDLRATPDQCPECGASPAARPAAQSDPANR